MPRHDQAAFPSSPEAVHALPPPYDTLKIAHRLWERGALQRQNMIVSDRLLPRDLLFKCPEHRPVGISAKEILFGIKKGLKHHLPQS